LTVTPELLPAEELLLTEEVPLLTLEDELELRPADDELRLVEELRLTEDELRAADELRLTDYVPREDELRETELRLADDDALRADAEELRAAEELRTWLERRPSMRPVAARELVDDVASSDLLERRELEEATMLLLEARRFTLLETAAA
jgi:hypothetical protein